MARRPVRITCEGSARGQRGRPRAQLTSSTMMTSKAESSGSEVRRRSRMPSVRNTTLLPPAAVWRRGGGGKGEGVRGGGGGAGGDTARSSCARNYTRASSRGWGEGACCSGGGTINQQMGQAAGGGTPAPRAAPEAPKTLTGHGGLEPNLVGHLVAVHVQRLMGHAPARGRGGCRGGEALRSSAAWRHGAPGGPGPMLPRAPER